MKALITGGLGFIGACVVAELHRRDYDVHVVDNLFTGSIDRTQDFPPETKVHVADIRDAEAISKIVKQVEPQVVIHLAALHYIPYCNANPLECYDVNVRGTSVLLDSLEQSRVERLFIASSAAVYQPSAEPHREENPGWPVDIYGLSKRVNEFAATEWSARTGIPVVLGRFFNVFGYGETSPHITPVLINQVQRNGAAIKLGNLISRRDYIHVTDLARLTVDLLDLAHEGVLTINLGTGKSYSVQDMLDILSELLQRPLEVLQDERRMRKQDRPNLAADLTHFHSLGLTSPQVSLADGLKELLEGGVGPYLSSRLDNFLGDK